MNTGFPVRLSGAGPRSVLAGLIVLAALLAGRDSAAQSYASGQNVSPAFEGWEQEPDGSRYFLFGYMNRNWEEELNVPVGPDNRIDPGGPDLGQPTRFLPRRNRFVFRVRAPKSFGDKDELVWTLTTKGKTEKAYATLRPDYFVDDVVKASETGALGAGTSNPEIRANKPPVVRLDGDKTRTVKVGEPLVLSAVVTDDGVPKARRDGVAGVNVGAAVRDEAGGRGPAAPAAGRGGSSAAALLALFGRGGDPAYFPPVRPTVGKTVGLHLAWFVYRGPGAVKFDPPQVKVWEDTRTGANAPWAPLWTAPEVPADGRYVARAVFTEPGTYVLRARADDGALLGDQELTVTVTR